MMFGRLRKVVLVGATAGLVLGTTAGAEAATIDGGIRFAGSINPNTDFATTNSMDIVDNVANILCFSGAGAPCTGDYAALNGPTGAGQSVYNDFTFNPLPPGGVAPLWIFTRGDVTYSFDLTQVTAFNRVSNGTSISGISVFGTGIARITGFEPTLALWSFTASSSGNTFGFHATTDASGLGLPGDPGAPVPEPASMLLLGTGLAGLVARRRQLTARNRQ